MRDSLSEPGRTGSTINVNVIISADMHMHHIILIRCTALSQKHSMVHHQLQLYDLTVLRITVWIYLLNPYIGSFCVRYITQAHTVSVLAYFSSDCMSRAGGLNAFPLGGNVCLTCCPKKTCRSVLNVPSKQSNPAGNMDVKYFCLSLSLLNDI